MINHRYNIYKKNEPRGQAKSRSRACVYIIEFLLIQAAYVERMPQADRGGAVVGGGGSFRSPQLVAAEGIENTVLIRYFYQLVKQFCPRPEQLVCFLIGL